MFSKILVKPTTSRSAIVGWHVLPSPLVLSFLSLFFLIGVGMCRAEKLTLAQSINIALQYNPAVRIARENVQKTAAYIDEASAAGMPKLTIEGTYMRLDEVSSANVGGNDVDLNSLDNRSADLSLVQPVDVFGIIKLGRRMARLERTSVQHAYDQVRNDITLEVKKAYYGVLRAQQYLLVHEESVKQLDAHLKDAQIRFGAGAIPRFDVLRAETELANAEQGLISAQHGVDLAKSAFNNVLGRDPETPVDIEETAQSEYVEVQMQECTDLACEVRPEIMKANTGVEFAEKMIKIEGRGSKPSINLLWEYNRNFSPTVFNPRDSSWRAFITTSMSIFDGGATKAAVERARSDAENARSGRDQVVLGVKLDVRQAYLHVKESQERIRAASKGLEQARESMRLAQVRYKGGVSTQVEVMDAQAALTLAETNYVNARYDYDVAIAELEKAVGGQAQMAKLREGAAKPEAVNKVAGHISND